MSTASEAGRGGPMAIGTARFDADAGAGAVRPAPRALTASGAWSVARSAGIVLLLVVLGLVLLPRPTSPSQPAVDVAARAAASGFPRTPAVPQNLPVTWTPTEAGLQHAREGVLTWRVTYRTPSGGWIGLRQGVDPNLSWEDMQVINGVASTRYQIDGRTWVQRDRADRLMRNLVTYSEGLTTVISGTGPQSELFTLIGALPPESLGTPLPDDSRPS